MAGGETGVLLVCRVGRVLCALPLEHVVTTVRPLAIEPVAGAPDFVMGVSIVHGTALPVVSVARVLGEHDVQASHLVIVRAGGHRVALAVAAVLDIRAMPDAADLPPLLRDAPFAAVQRISTLDGELLIVLQAARILPDDFVAAIAAKTVAA